MQTEVNYYWYHHMMPQKDREAIQRCIDEGDYFEFINWYKKYNSKGIKEALYIKEFDTLCPIIYLPNEASIYDIEKNEFIEYLDILNQENFKKITFSESECG